MKKQSEDLTFDPAELEPAATLLDVVRWYRKRLHAAKVEAVDPVVNGPMMLDYAAAYSKQLAELQAQQL